MITAAISIRLATAITFMCVCTVTHAIPAAPWAITQLSRSQVYPQETSAFTSVSGVIFSASISPIISLTVIDPVLHYSKLTVIRIFILSQQNCLLASNKYGL